MSAVEIRRLGPDDWEILRQIRLAALSDSPAAFASTLERELSFDEDTWRSRTLSSCSLVATLADRPVATAALIVLSGEAVSPVDNPVPVGAAFHLVAMWVEPDSRGHGIAGRLITALAAEAKERGASALELWVVEDNEAAIKAYERAGFRPTGGRTPLPHSPAATEEMMRLYLD